MNSYSFLDNVRKQFEYYKMLGDKTFAQIPDEALFWQPSAESNSISTIVKHLWGNMRSRWIDFLTSDGEKPWRDRETEFDQDLHSREEVIQKWEEGWNCLFTALNQLSEEDLEKIIYIRNQGHTVAEAIHRQLAHYPYHIGQIVFIGKMIAQESWKSLSIPRGKSQEFNQAKFSQTPSKKHFTDESLDKK